MSMHAAKRLWAGGAALCVCVAVCCAASGQELTRAQLLSRLKDIYAGPVSGAVQVAEYDLPDSRPVATESLADPQASIGVAPLGYFRISWDTLDWVLIDRSNPNARKYMSTVAGQIRQRNYTVKLGADLVERRVESFALFSRETWTCFPPAIPAVVEFETQFDFAASVLPDGLVQAQGRSSHDGQIFSITFAGTDLALVRYGRGSPGGPHSTHEVIAYHEPSGLAYRWPRAVVYHTEGYGYPALDTLRVAAAPDLKTPVSSESLRWWTYAPASIDHDTGAIYGPNDEVRRAGGPLPQPIRTATSIALGELHAKAASDPSVKIVPPEQSTTGRYLLVGGVVCLVLAAALVARRTLGR